MIEDLEEMRERIADLPDEEQGAALFALEAIEDELEESDVRLTEDHAADVRQTAGA